MGRAIAVYSSRFRPTSRVAQRLATQSSATAMQLTATSMLLYTPEGRSLAPSAALGVSIVAWGALGASGAGSINAVTGGELGAAAGTLAVSSLDSGRVIAFAGSAAAAAPAALANVSGSS